MEKIKSIAEARAQNNGIVFCSNLYPSISVEMSYDDCGNLKKRLIPTDLYLFEMRHKITSNLKIWHLIILKLVILIFSIILCAILKKFSFISSGLFLTAVISLDCLHFIEHCYNIKSSNIAKYHAAEHMAINAYETLQRIPTLEEVKKFPRFCKDCGSYEKFLQLFKYFYYTFTIILSGYNILFSILLVLLFLLILFFSQRNGILSFLQVFVTTKPSDKELILAIEGLKQFEIMEESIKNGKIFSMIIE